MQRRIMQVFYDNDCLPFKDSERTVHYPIVGNSFAGSNNVDKIRFYVDRIGGVNNVTWVSNTKLPNGKIIFQVLSTVALDNELGEYYVELDISQFYTQLKGDIYISLNGCDGNVEIETDSNDIQTITATIENSTVQATGAIKLSINYATQRPLGFSYDLDQYQDIITALSNKSNVTNTIQVVSNIATTDLSDYEQGQLFYDLYNKSYYEKTATSPYYKLGENKGILGSKYTIVKYAIDALTTFGNLGLDTATGFSVISYQNNDYLITKKYSLGSENAIVGFDLANKTILYKNYYGATPTLANSTIANYLSTATKTKFVEQSSLSSILYGTLANGNQTTIAYDTNASDSTIAQRDSNGQLNVPLTPTANSHATSKQYVDSAIQEIKENELQVVDTTTYPTLNSFLASTGEEGIIYLYPVDLTDLTKGYYRYIWENNDWLNLGTTEIDLSDYYTKTQIDNNFVAQTSNAEKVYGTSELGSQMTYDVDSDLVGDGPVVRRNTNGTVVVGTPTSNTHATTKSYVDSGLATKQATLVSGTNIKTINNTSLLGSGNYTFDSELNDSSTNAPQTKVVKEITDNIVTDLEDGGIVPLQAKNIAPISEESGAIQDTPFIYQGTGTANGSAIVDTGPVGKQLEKQGNTVVVNQQCRNPNFTTNTMWDILNGTLTVANNIGTYKVTTVAETAYGNRLSANSGNSFTITGHKYLVMFEAKSSVAGLVIWYSQTGSNRGCNATTVANTWVKGVGVFEANENTSVWLRVSNPSLLNVNDTVDFKNAYIIDLTQWFNGDIPQDLLDNPSNFFRYYNGSLVYNTGTLVNSDGQYLTCGGRNVWDEEWEQGVYNQDTGVKNNGSRLRCKNPIRVIPNETYYIYVGTNSGLYLYFYDANGNFLSRQGSGRNTTFTTPSNAIYMTFNMYSEYGDGTTYNHDITISIYYATGDGYDQYYPYEQPKVYDTGAEVLRKAGSVKDYKTPDGTIHRLVGVVDLGTLEWNKITGYGFYSTGISSLVKAGSKPLCSKYVSNGTPNDWTSGNCFIGSTGNIGIADLSYDDGATFKTAMSGVYLYYELATSTIEQGTPFQENIEINDYGTMEWNVSNGVPQGCKIFYPADYVLFVDSLGQYTNWTATNIAKKSDFDGYEKVVDESANLTNSASLTINYAKVTRIGSLVSLSISAKNETGANITAGTTLFELPTRLVNTLNFHRLPCVNSITVSFITLTSNGEIQLASDLAYNTTAFIDVIYHI